MSRLNRTTIYSLVLFCAVSTGVVLGQAKRTVNTAPICRFSYPLPQSASSLLKADDVTFNVLVKKVEIDVIRYWRTTTSRIKRRCENCWAPG